MAVSVRSCALLLVAVVAVCIQLYQAHDIQIRCSCHTTVKFTRLNISDFQVLERRSGCDKTELIVTVSGNNNSTNKLCMDTVGKMAKAFIKCWERINKNETRKMECIDRRRRNE